MPSLEMWESRLKPFFESQLRIIGEIPLSESDLDELAEDVRHFLNAFSKFNRATEDLTHIYPYAFLTLLAHFAAHNDEAGYWEALQQKIGAPQDLHITRWHQRFVTLAQQHGLKTFTDAEAANYYVATIRFHGGIPAYSLPDLFDRMVRPAVEEKKLREIPPKDALAYLLERVHFVDRPVLDFLSNSGEMGLAWFEACCKLVKHARQNHGEVLPISLVPELPYYIHAFFEQYNEEQQDHGFRWSRPYLEATPFSEDSPIVLHIPEQGVPMQVANQGLQWSITWPGLESPVVIPCQPKHRREGEFTPEESFTVPTPTTQVTVSIFSGLQEVSEGSELRRWTISLVPPPDQAPLIAFRENRRHFPNSQTLPAQVLYLLTPGLSALEMDGQPQNLDSFSSFSGDWKSWKLELWDLSDAVSLLLYQDGKELGNIIPVAREIAQPELMGGHLFDYQEYPDQPLYTSEIPCISIPITANVTEYEALNGWKMHVASLGEAAPMIDKQVTMLDFQDHCLFEGSRASFPLQALLGDKPAGIYDIKVSGPRGLKSEYRLRLWPKLLLQNYSKELPTPIESRQPVKFSIHLQDAAWVENQPGADPIEITQDTNRFSIVASPETRRVQLDLVTPTVAGGQVRVPVSIPVVRLRWSVAEENSPVKFAQQVVHISKERFAQHASSAIHVELHGLSTMMGHLSCQLVEIDNEGNLLQLADFSRTGFTTDWLRVSLLQFDDTIQASNTQVQFQLVYQKDGKAL